MKAPFAYPADMQFGLSNCGIVANAIAARCSLTEATEWFRVNQRPRGNWRDSTNHGYYDRFLREHGIWFERVQYGRDRMRTVGDFVEWFGKPGRLYMIRSAGHMMICQDGWIGDQHRITMMRGSDFWKRNARVKDHWEIF